jgi:hypothetical protein
VSTQVWIAATVDAVVGMTESKSRAVDLVDTETGGMIATRHRIRPGFYEYVADSGRTYYVGTAEAMLAEGFGWALTGATP